MLHKVHLNVDPSICTKWQTGLKCYIRGIWTNHSVITLMERSDGDAPFAYNSPIT